jgi:uncharacterized protein YegJ (DUF2314 family)
MYPGGPKQTKKLFFGINYQFQIPASTVSATTFDDEKSTKRLLFATCFAAVIVLTAIVGITCLTIYDLYERIEARRNIVGIPKDDARIEEQARKARKDWPKFVAFYNGKKPGDYFGVKTCLEDEHIWVTVSQIDDKTVSGTLANDPINRKFGYGAPVKFEVNKVEDWVYSRDGKNIGYYSIAIVGNALTKARVHELSPFVKVILRELIPIFK